MLPEAERTLLSQIASRHPEAGYVSDNDPAGRSLFDGGYLEVFEAPYVDWYGCWATVTEKGWTELRRA